MIGHDSVTRKATSCHESPSELVDLVVAQMWEKRGEDRRVRHVFARVSGVAVLTRLRVAGFFGRALVCSAAGAEDSVGDFLGAMVAPHGRKG